MEPLVLFMPWGTAAAAWLLLLLLLLLLFEALMFHHKRHWLSSVDKTSLHLPIIHVTIPITFADSYHHPKSTAVETAEAYLVHYSMHWLADYDPRGVQPLCLAAALTTLTRSLPHHLIPPHHHALISFALAQYLWVEA